MVRKLIYSLITYDTFYSFWSQGVGSESDMRFVFCAVAICKILDGEKEEVINWVKLSEFLKSSLNIDGGIGQAPGDESHG